ncbi:hypothetical protein [Undibacterium fentianense]|uniref:Uncharacterized protein n=1 Tax=Undibacterium fentianense TaxID=2828728 RepID=A0A941IFL7_9BURK|nr:hypothetical protein [Undibacterium fentianense]MBR7800851.1 hypothetical protein [Undibacterium fentianense]
MKKYTALALTLISVLGLIWVGVVLTKMQFGGSVYRPEAISNQQLVKEGDTAKKNLQSLSSMLVLLDQMKTNPSIAFAPVAQGPELKAGKPSYVSNPAAVAAAAAAAAKKAIPAISMIYVSSDMQKVVINGRAYEVGDVLPNGGKILEINLDQVAYEQGKRRLIMKAPQSQVLGTTVKPVLE